MEKVSLNLLDVGNKAISKGDLNRILTVDGNFLMPYKLCTIDFIVDIIDGNRKVNT